MRDIVPLVTVSSGLEAELACQTLEAAGIPATYLGRADTGPGAIPGRSGRLAGRHDQCAQQKTSSEPVSCWRWRGDSKPVDGVVAVSREPAAPTARAV